MKGVDLSNANMFKADLSSADLRGAVIKGANFTKARFDRARLNNLNFNQSTVVLCDFSKADLSNSVFEGMDISYISFEGALMSGSDLSRTVALGSNFQFANLTAACIEDWNINQLTQIEHIICDYVFLKSENKERKPGSGKFKPDEFAILVRQAVETVDLIFSEAIDWSSLAESFQSIKEQYGEQEFSVQSVERKGDLGVVVKLSVPDGFEEIDRSEVEAKIKAVYEDKLRISEQRFQEALRKLEDKDSILRVRDREIAKTEAFLRVLHDIAGRSVNLNVRAIAGSKSMQGSDYSRNISAGQDIHISNSSLNLGDISGHLTNQISQLAEIEDDASTDSLSNLLTKLQEAIEAEADLSSDEKEEALVEVSKLAKAGLKQKSDAVRRMANRASSSLKNIASVLSDTSKLAQACKTLLPMIITFF